MGIIVPHLKGVSLCAIVKDELHNPAGGIVDFVHHTMPFLEGGVIVDTGSSDGTREALEEATHHYPNLKVYDHPFDGFAASRNYALSQVDTPWALVLDADERLFQQDYADIAQMMKVNPLNGYNFDFLLVSSLFGSNNLLKGHDHNPRLFKKEKVEYRYTVGEVSFYRSIPLAEHPKVDLALPSRERIGSVISIKHFLSPKDYLDAKEAWYQQFFEASYAQGHLSASYAQGHLPLSPPAQDAAGASSGANLPLSLPAEAPRSLYAELNPQRSSFGPIITTFPLPASFLEPRPAGRNDLDDVVQIADPNLL